MVLQKQPGQSEWVIRLGFTRLRMRLRTRDTLLEGQSRNPEDTMKESRSGTVDTLGSIVA